MPVILESLEILIPCAQILIHSRRGRGESSFESVEVTRSIEDVCRFQPQVAIIANEAPLHLETASILVEIGCHILIEKPLDIDAERCLQFFETHCKKSVVVQVGYNLRYLEQLYELRESLVSREAGALTSAFFQVGQFLPSWRNEREHLTSVSALKALGGGVLLELSHEIDSVEWILGHIIWVQAWADKTSHLVVDVEDLACLVFGVRCRTDNEEIVVSLTMDFIRHNTTRNYTVVGSKGTLVCDLVSQETKFYSKSGQMASREFIAGDRDLSYKRQFSDFLHRIECGDCSWDSFYSGVRVLRILDAVRKSIDADGTRVLIE